MGIETGTALLISALIGAGGSAISAIGAGGQELKSFGGQSVLNAINEAKGKIRDQLDYTKKMREQGITLPKIDVSGMVGPARISGLPSGTVGIMPGVQKMLEGGTLKKGLIGDGGGDDEDGEPPTYPKEPDEPGGKPPTPIPVDDNTPQPQLQIASTGSQQQAVQGIAQVIQQLMQMEQGQGATT